MALNFVAAIDPTTIVFLVMLVVLIIVLLIVPLIRRNAATQVPTDVSDKTSPRSSSATSKPNKPTKKYYRFQHDNQRVTVRTAEQLRIVNEYFIVRNKIAVKKDNRYLALGIVVPIASALALTVGIMQSISAYIVVGAIGIFIGAALLVTYRATMKFTVASERILTDEQYDELVENHIDSLDLPSLARTKFGLASYEVTDEPIISVAFVRNKTSLVNYTDETQTLRSSSICASVLLFARDRMYVYKRQFDMCCNDMTERACEFRFDDICGISLDSDRSVATAPDCVFDNTETALVICTAGSSIAIPLRSGDGCRVLADAVRTAVRNGQVSGDLSVQEKTSVSAK